MGTYHPQLESATASMIHFIYLACLSVAWAAPQPPEYPTPAPTQEYNPDIGQTNVGGYGVNKDPYCHMWRRWCSRISASRTLRERATLRTRSLASPGSSTTARGSSRPRLNAFALM